MQFRAWTIALTVTGAMTLMDAATPTAAEDGVDLSCSWRSLKRRSVVRGGSLSLRVLGRLDVACDGAPGPRRVTVGLYASSDGVAAETLLATRRIRPRSGRKVVVRLDARMPLGAAGRYVVARVDDGNEAAERDETNNAASAGPFSTGEEYAPLEPGNQWRYSGAQTVGRESPVAFTNVVVDEGDHVVGDGSVAQAVSSSNSRNAGRAIVEYLHRDQLGVMDWGNDDASDWITSQIVPFRALLLPFASRYEFVPVVRRRLSGLGDVDGDGRAERLDAVQRVRFFGFEDIDLAVGRFANCAHLRTSATATVTLSRSGYRFRVVGTQHQWLAPRIGPVRKVEDYSGPGVREHVEETLTGAATTTAGCGLVGGLTLLSRAAPYDDPSPPAVASDGSIVLIVDARSSTAGGSTGLIGAVAAPTGRNLREFQIADFPVAASDPATPAAAYGAGEFLVAYRRAGEPLHLRAVTTDGAFPWGAATVDLPIATGTEGAFSVSFDGSAFVVLCEGWELPAQTQTVVVARVTPAGELLETRRLADSFIYYGGVVTAWDGTTTLCIWSVDSELRAVRLSGTGALLDATPIRFAGSVGAGKSRPAAAASPSGGWLVAWTQSPSAAPTRVRRCRMSSDGVPDPVDGTEIESSASIETSPAVALDGAEFVVVCRSFAPESIHAVRLTLDDHVVDPAHGGFDAAFATFDWTGSFSPPVAVRMGNRMLAAWRSRAWTSGTDAEIDGALVFPRRADLREGAR